MMSGERRLAKSTPSVALAVALIAMSAVIVSFADAQPFPGGLRQCFEASRQCQADLVTCNAEQRQCESDLAACATERNELEATLRSCEAEVSSLETWTCSEDGRAAVSTHGKVILCGYYACRDGHCLNGCNSNLDCSGAGSCSADAVCLERFCDDDESCGAGATCFDPVPSKLGVCLITCSTDDQCPHGFHCNAGLGFCFR